MLLTTKGRRSGLPRIGPVSFMPVDDHFVVFSGWGITSNWYQNVRANPEVTITVGRRRMRAMARLVEDPDRRRTLMLRQQARSSGCGPPKPVRPVLKLLKMFDYDGEITMAVAAGPTPPISATITIFGVSPKPPAEFSPFATTRSIDLAGKSRSKVLRCGT